MQLSARLISLGEMLRTSRASENIKPDAGRRRPKARWDTVPRLGGRGYGSPAGGAAAAKPPPQERGVSGRGRQSRTAEKPRPEAGGAHRAVGAARVQAGPRSRGLTRRDRRGGCTCWGIRAVAL